MKTIWKFPFAIDDKFGIEMPQGARILSVMLQGATPTMWAEVDPTAKMHRRFFRVFGTGHPIPAVDMTYIGTFQQPPFVWHVYEF